MTDFNKSFIIARGSLASAALNEKVNLTPTLGWVAALFFTVQIQGARRPLAAMKPIDKGGRDVEQRL